LFQRAPRTATSTLKTVKLRWRAVRAALTVSIGLPPPKLMTVSAGNTNFIFINTLSGNNIGALKDLRVRQALEYAVDKAAAVQQQGGPTVAKPVNGIFGVGVLGYHEFDLFLG